MSLTLTHNSNFSIMSISGAKYNIRRRIDKRSALHLAALNGKPKLVFLKKSSALKLLYLL